MLNTTREHGNEGRAGHTIALAILAANVGIRSFSGHRSMPREGVFLDRDGTLIDDVHYLSRIDQVQMLPGAAEALARLNTAGVLVVVVTNQAGVARGYFPEDRISEVHQHLNEVLAKFGASVDAYYYCPHHPDGVGDYRQSCDCRKPKPGMLLTAAHDLDIDLTRSWMIGDKLSDIEAGAAAGCRTILVRTGYGETEAQTLPKSDLRLVGIVADISEAVELWSSFRTGPGMVPN